jgi:hypothetical protein
MKYNFVLNHLKLNTMKKKISVLIDLLFILVIFWGCQEDVVEPVAPVASKYIIQVNQNGPGSVIPSGAITALQGEILSLAVTKDIGVVVKATLNGTELSLKDGKYYVPVTSSGTVNVEFEKTPKWQLAQHSWDYFSREVRVLKTDEYLYTAYAPKDMKYEKLIFDEDSIKVYDVSGKQVAANPYKMVNDTTFIEGTDLELKIIEISDEKLVLSSMSRFYEVFPVVKRVPEKDQRFIETYKKHK